MNRKRLKGDTSLDDCRAAVETLFIVIYSMVKVMVSTRYLPHGFCIIYELLTKVNHMRGSERFQGYLIKILYWEALK